MINVAKMIISVSYWVENIVGKGENAGYQHFLLFQQCFQKASPLGSLKVGIVWERVKQLVQALVAGRKTFFPFKSRFKVQASDIL